MSFLRKLSKKDEARLERVPSYTQSNRPTQDVPPPSYTIDDPLTQGTVEDLTAAFANIRVSSFPKPFPEPEHCIVHLKLLAAFSALKGDVGNTDELFGIEDRSVEKVEDRQRALDALKEKRWALYVARAVDRFQDWWLNVLVRDEGAERITCTQLATDPYAPRFSALANPKVWNVSNLPPLDVLMVWHTFMLNPRDYFQDCVRYGLADIWATGMPWAAVNDAIDIDFNYDVPQAGKIRFTNGTGRHWDNVEDSLHKDMSCPDCRQRISVPWTTCMNTTSIDYTELSGTGLGDKDFLYRCTKCCRAINHELLRVAKFRDDAENLLLYNWPMCGTILDREGQLPVDPIQFTNDGNFPNRLVKLVLRSQVLELIKVNPAPEINDIKQLIEVAIKDETNIRKVNEHNDKLPKSRLVMSDKVAIRKMMSKYWDNASIFSMELGGAVMRQGLFVDKMQKLDWLHSPAAGDTMKRLLVKYGRFIELMDKHPRNVVVPTLDVDLGWHTHQLSPQAYYTYMMEKTKRFINHDDKISEDKISEFFEWTSEIYQKTYQEVYSECTCWYCETMRYRHTSNIVFGSAKYDKPADEFYESGRAKLCPPDNSAHISNHNAVRINESDIRAKYFDRARQAKRRAIDVSYVKACKKAEKKGRKPPRRDEYYRQSHWGSPAAYAYPFLAVPVVVGGVYFAGEVDSMNAGADAHGVCAAGSCGGDPISSGDSGMGFAAGGVG